MLSRIIHFHAKGVEDIRRYFPWCRQFSMIPVQHRDACWDKHLSPLKSMAVLAFTSVDVVLTSLRFDAKVNWHPQPLSWFICVVHINASKRQNPVCKWSNEQTANVTHKYIYWSSQRHHPFTGGETSIHLLCGTGDKARVYHWGAFAGLIDASLMPLHYVVLISVQSFRYSVLTDTQTA